MKRSIQIGIGVVVLILCLLLTSTTTTREYFCPQTLDFGFQEERQLAWLGLPIHRSRMQKKSTLLFESLKARRIVEPTQATPQWLDIGSRKTGDREISGVGHLLVPEQYRTVKRWTEEHPEVADYLWLEVVRLLRSSDADERKNGAEAIRLLSEGTRLHPETEGMARQLIALAGGATIR